MDMGARITERLEDLGMSQTELARRTGLKQPSIHYLIKKGARGSAHLHKIARELITTPAYLVYETDDPSIDAAALALTSEDQEWLELLHALTPKDREAALQLVRTIAHSAASPIVSDKGPKFRG
jgi:transcriptional regulator with XRE-family HTH domain